MIKHPLSTEKAIRLMEAENKMVFIVDSRATKPEIRTEIEKLFEVKVLAVRTLNDTKGRKKAIVTFSPETPAIDIASRLGLM
jgi:ribosomal protein uL23